MALKPCRECKSMVSDEAKICPNCGIQKPVKRSAKWIWIALGVVVLFIVFSPKNDSSVKNANPTGSASTQRAEPTVERAAKQVEAAMQDPRKVRLMECMGVNPWKEKPAGWTPPTEGECNQLKQVLGAEADAREKSSSKK
ncbi:hypothetical protein CDA09_23060 [Azoarcus sp. DN11]|nr:hypothetical protein CDA09_23060 [Azoarcus sp. DN11]